MFGEALRKVEAESLAYRLSDEGKRPDWKTMTVLVTVAACLTLQNFTAHPDRLIPATRFVVGLVEGPAAARAAERTLLRWSFDQLSSRAWWATCTFITYAVIPMLVIKFAFRERIIDYGLKIRGAIDAWRIYVLFLLVMVPLVTVCSREEHFQRTYPMYGFTSVEQVRAELWQWELWYAIQFVGLEFFFRGFMVLGTKHRFGVYSIFVMTVPYCMIHFGKPVPECAASIVAGVALGIMSLVTRSIWLGAAIHIAVAWGMDCACLARRGLLTF